MENKTTIQMTIRKGEQTEMVRLPCDFLTIKVALYQIDVLKAPDEVAVQDVGATFQSDDVLGRKLTAMIQPTDLLSDVDVTVHLLRAAPKPVREALSKYALGYDLMVKDEKESPDWICYENLSDEVRYHVWNLEREMFLVLDRAVEQFGLSYTQCRFPKVDGSKC